MKKDAKIFILIIVISVALFTAIDIQTKGKVTSLMAYVNPTNLQSSGVRYGSNGQNYVQGALDNLYSKATEPNAKNNVMYYEYGEPTTSSTTDYGSLNKKIFLALNGGQKSICIIRNGRLHCFDNNNYIIEKEHVKEVFSDITCKITSSSVSCNDGKIECDIFESGSVSAYDFTDESEHSIENGKDRRCGKQLTYRNNVIGMCKVTIKIPSTV